MSAPGSKDRRAHWIEKARRLDDTNYFAAYPKAKHAEVLRKGYLGILRPDVALELARTEIAKGLARHTPKIITELHDHYGIIGTEERTRFLASRLREIAPDCYEPPQTLEEPPGYPYVFISGLLGQRVYLKFQIVGTVKKHQIWFWSCHPPRR